MNNSIINNYLKNHKILYAAALAASLVYCIAMTSMGITLNQQIVNSHLDVLLANTLIVLIGYLYSGRYVCGILAIWLGFLVKTLPIMWLPLVFAFLFHPRRGRDLAAGFLLSLLRITVITYTFLPTVAAWKSLLNPRVVSGTAQKRKYSFPLHREFTVAVDRNFLTFLLTPNL